MKRHVRRHAVVSIALAALVCSLPGAARTQAGIHRARFGHGLALGQGNGDNEGGNR
jgi:hypothetical protein